MFGNRKDKMDKPSSIPPVPSTININVYLHNLDDGTAKQLTSLGVKVDHLTEVIIAAFSGDPAKIETLAQRLSASSTKLAAAVEANKI
jgi:hypothetical protein